jgi:hypothetical protein
MSGLVIVSIAANGDVLAQNKYDASVTAKEISGCLKTAGHSFSAERRLRRRERMELKAF